jgi:hypothetical protein
MQWIRREIALDNGEGRTPKDFTAGWAQKERRSGRRGGDARGTQSGQVLTSEDHLLEICLAHFLYQL